MPARQVLDCIEAEMKNELRVGALANVANLGLHHFSAAFLASTGLRQRFILNCRIERAKVLLLTADCRNQLCGRLSQPEPLRKEVSRSGGRDASTFSARTSAVRLNIATEQRRVLPK